MSSPHTILCLGEILLRLTPPDHELLLQSPRLGATIAGAEANVAAALARFGHRAVMLSVLPDQPVAKAAIAELRREGIDVSRIAQADGRMGLFYFTPGAVTRPSAVDYDRRNSAFALHPELADPAPALSGARWFHVSGITPALGRNCATAAIAAARKARAAGLTVSFDGNYRSKLWDGWAAEAPGILRQMMAEAHILIGDERDIALVLGTSFDAPDPETRRRQAIDAAFAAFPQLTTVTCTTRATQSAGRQSYGAGLYARDGTWQVAPVELEGIVDRLGTGDAFAAGIIHGMLTAMPLRETLDFAHAAACLKHAVPGDFLRMDAHAVSAAIGRNALDVQR